MAVVTFRRPARRELPALVIRQVEVRPPPALPERQSRGVSAWLTVLPALGGLGAMALILALGVFLPMWNMIGKVGHTG